MYFLFIYFFFFVQLKLGLLDIWIFSSWPILHLIFFMCQSQTAFFSNPLIVASTLSHIYMAILLPNVFQFFFYSFYDIYHCIIYSFLIMNWIEVGVCWFISFAMHVFTLIVESVYLAYKSFQEFVVYVQCLELCYKEN